MWAVTAGRAARVGRARQGPRGQESAGGRRTRRVVEHSTTLVHPRRGEAHPARPQAGERLVLGRYRLVEQLGAGGFGVVWRAYDEQLRREVALKRIALPGAEQRQRAAREALASARLSHPAIVALYEAWADDEAFYLVSELVHGRTLAESIAADELDDEQIVQIGLAVARALAHAHARGVIHRDVKPHNVMVPHAPEGAPDGEPGGAAGQDAPAKLADFGGARLAEENDALTRTGDVLGTLAYMAPEQSDGLQAGPEADVYSLALVLYEALTGVNPVRGVTPADTARRIGERIEPLERHRCDLPRELTRAIGAALDADPLRRATLDELTEALQCGLEGGAKRRVGFASGRAQAAGVDDRGGEHGHYDGAGSLRSRDTAVAAAGEGRRSDEEDGNRRPLSRLLVPRPALLAGLAGLAAWQAAAGRPGVSLLVVAGGLPLLMWPRTSPGWLLAALAPALGTVGLAGAYPALAGQRGRVLQRAGTAALGAWWVSLAEPLLGERLWMGPPTGLGGRAAWEGSLQASAAHALAGALTVGLLATVLVWGAAAAVLPWIVRGRSAALDVAAALTWTVALVCAVPLLAHGVAGGAAAASPRGALLGAVGGCALAVCARALRGPV